LQQGQYQLAIGWPLRICTSITWHSLNIENAQAIAGSIV
jgi:hypothetical protein